MFECKVRAWWRYNPDYPGGREPCAPSWDTVRVRARFNTEKEARAWCREYNATHKPGPLSIKAEWGEVKP